MPKDDKYFTELDMDLQRLAAVDWPAFVKIIGEEAILSAKVCLLKSRGKTQAQIATRVNIPLHKAQYRSEKCRNISCE